MARQEKPAKLRDADAAAPLPARVDAAKMLKLIEAAEAIFLQKGYHTATMSDVAKAAGMSKKTIYQLIDSKSELFGVLMSHYQSMLTLPRVQPGWSVNDILVENLLCLARFLLSPEQIAIIRLIMAEYTNSPDLGRIFLQKRVKKAKATLEACLLEIGAREGTIMRNTAEMSAMLFGMAIGEFHLSVLIGFRAAPTRPTLERRVRHAVDLFLAGCHRLGEASEPTA